MVLRAPIDPDVVAVEWENNVPLGLIDWNAYQIENPAGINGPAVVRGVLNPVSLDEKRVGFLIEFQITGENPVMSFGFENHQVYTIADATPMGDGWVRLNVFAARLDGSAFGNGLDSFEYTGRDIQARKFRFMPAGKIGDVNLDGAVDIDDLLLVANNQGLVGSIGVEDGDANTDGVVDLSDVQVVVEDLLTEN